MLYQWVKLKSVNTLLYISKDAEVIWYIIKCDAGKNMRQEWREKEESDSSAGKKHETIWCWLPAVPPFSLHSPSSSLLPISPAVYEGIQSVSVREPAYAHWGQHTQAHSAKQKQATKTVSVNLWNYIFFYNVHPLHAHWYSYFFTPQHTWLFSLPLIMQTWLTHTHRHRNTANTDTYTERRAHTVRGPL